MKAQTIYECIKSVIKSRISLRLQQYLLCRHRAPDAVLGDWDAHVGLVFLGAMV